MLYYIFLRWIIFILNEFMVNTVNENYYKIFIITSIISIISIVSIISITYIYISSFFLLKFLLVNIYIYNFNIYLGNNLHQQYSNH